MQQRHSRDGSIARFFRGRRHVLNEVPYTCELIGCNEDVPVILPKSVGVQENFVDRNSAGSRCLIIPEQGEPCLFGGGAVDLSCFPKIQMHL